MSNYVVLLYQDEKQLDQLTDAERMEVFRGHQQFREKYGAAVGLGHGLQSTGTGRCVDSRAGTVTDGPFVETKEALGGFYLIEAEDLDAAVAMAADIPAPFGGIEIRPIMVLR